MDRASEGLRLDGQAYPGPDFDNVTGPTTRAIAIGMLRKADDLMEESEPDQALVLYGRAAGSPERDVAAAGVFGMGNALYRLDRDDEALQAWQRVVEMPETPITYRAWRQIAAARVRMQDLPAALAAYRQCDRRAPAADKAEIQARLGWLSKETGNTAAASRHFARSRGDALPAFMTYMIMGVTIVTSLVAMQAPGAAFGTSPVGGPLELQLQMDKFAIASGEWYRLFSVMLVHAPDDILHLAFNMYALWFVGQLVERMYGARFLLFFYLVSGLSGSIASYVFESAPYGVGASGAIFGLFGIVLVATRYHHAVLDSQSRAIAAQVGVLIVINLFLGLSGIFSVDNFAHIGGLAAGMWLAVLLPPGRVPTLLTFWQNRRDAGASRASRLLPVGVGLIVLAAVLFAGYLEGTSTWKARLSSPYGATPNAQLMRPAGDESFFGVGYVADRQDAAPRCS